MTYQKPNSSTTLLTSSMSGFSGSIGLAGKGCVVICLIASVSSFTAKFKQHKVEARLVSLCDLLRSSFNKSATMSLIDFSGYFFYRRVSQSNAAALSVRFGLKINVVR